MSAVGPGHLRPMPDDFAQFAWVLGGRKLQAKYGAGQYTVDRWRRELQAEDPRQNMFIPPADFAASAAKMTLIDLARHYRVGDQRIKSWLRVEGVSAQKYVAKARRQSPDDFAAVAPTMTQNSLTKHYKADSATIKRWLSEVGVSALEFVHAWPESCQSARRIGWKAPRAPDFRIGTEYDDAADVVRRERFAVYRCTHKGVYAPNGDYWRVGAIVVTPSELLVRAERYRARAA